MIRNTKTFVITVSLLLSMWAIPNKATTKNLEKNDTESYYTTAYNKGVTSYKEGEYLKTLYYLQPFNLYSNYIYTPLYLGLSCIELNWYALAIDYFEKRPHSAEQVKKTMPLQLVILQPLTYL